MQNQPTWRWWAIALRGVAAILFGLLALFSPAAAFTSLVIVFGAFALVDGVLALSVARRRAGNSYAAMIARGIISIVAGIVALTWPGISALALLIVIGLWAIATGIFEVATSIHMRKEIQHEWLLGFEGTLSILFGAALLVSPLAGAIVLGLWVGAYALVIGIMLLATGFGLRSYQHHHPISAAG